MGIADRDYYRENTPARHGFLQRLTPVVKALLIANAALFILDYVVLPALLDLRVDGLRRPPLVKWGAFSVQSALFEFRVWEFLSFQFLHDSVGHLLFNSLGLYFFGPWMERWWGPARFLAFYLLCGCAGAALFTLLTLTGLIHGGLGTGLIGASAGIYGILAGVAVIAPDLRVMLLFPPIELSMRQLAIGLIAISTAIILIGIGHNEGGEAGHLGGAIAGLLLARLPFLLGRNTPDHPRPPRHAKSPPPLSASDPEVDRILDKISRDGFQSLTPAERLTLQQAATRPSGRRP